MRPPVRYLRSNLIFGHHGEVSSLYRLPLIAYPRLPDTEKWAWLWATASLAREARADVSVYRLQRRWPTSEYISQAVELMSPRTGNPEQWQRFVAGHVPHIDAMRAHVPEVFLRVTQEPGDLNQHQGRMRAIDHATRLVNTAFGVTNDAPLLERDIRLRLSADDRLLARLRRVIPPIDRVDARDVQWFCRRAGVRHIAEPLLDEHWKPCALVAYSEASDRVEFTPQESDFLPLFNATLHRPRPSFRHKDGEGDYLVVTDQGVTSYQSFLALGMLPEEVEFPGSQAELFAALDDLEFPVDAVLHAKFVENPRAVVETKKAIRDAETAIEEAFAGAHQPDNRQMINPEVGRQLEEDLLSDARPPLLRASIFFAVAGATREELEERVDAVRERMVGMTLHRPPGLQEHLYHEFLPQPGGGQLLDYRQVMTLQQFGMTMPCGAQTVSDGRGVHFAHTASEAPRPVPVNPMGAAMAGRPTGIYCAGRQGSGKTFCAMYLATIAALRGSYVLTADPGPDHHIVDVPELQAEAETIPLRAGEAMRGELDPLVVMPAELRDEIALSYWLDILPASPAKGDWEHELVQAVKAHTGGGSLALLDYLESDEVDASGAPLRSDAARDVGKRLRAISQVGLGILAFGDGSTARDFSQIKRITTIEMADLPLPKPGTPPESYTREQRIAVPTFRLVAGKLMWLVTHDRSVHKVVVLDEAWALPEWLLDKLLRLGRKYNATVIVCSQTVIELTEQMRALFSMYLLFGTNNLAEAMRGLDLIGADPDDTALASRVASTVFEKGRGLYRDELGQITEIQVDAVYPHLIEAYQTRPPEERAAA